MDKHVNTKKTATSSRLPSWLAALVLLILVAAHTQLTVRHLALWFTGVRYGAVEAIEAAPDGSATIVDQFAVYECDELVGSSLWIGDRKFTVVQNGRTYIRLDVPATELSAVEREAGYLTGVTEKSFIVRAALACPSIGFTLADCLLGLGVVFLAGYLLLTRQRPGQWLPPPGILLLLLVCLLSLFDWARVFDKSGNEADRGAGIKELIQYVEVWVVAYLFFVEVLRRVRMRRLAVATMLVMFGVVVVAGLVEYCLVLSGGTARGLLDIAAIDSLFGFRFNPSRQGVAGTESGKNVLGTYIIIMLPLAFAMLPVIRPLWQRLVLAMLCLLSLICVLHLGLLICAAAGCCAVAVASPRRFAVPLTLAAFPAVVGVTCLVSSHHGKVLLDSVALHRSADPYGLQPMPMKGQNWQHPRWNPWQQKYLEIQAALNAVGYSPVLGHGIGGYQRRINVFYSNSPMWSTGVEKSPVNLMEKDAHGLFLVQAVETGVLGLACLAGLLLAFLGRALKVRAAAAEPYDRALLIGVAAALVSILLGSWLISFVVRGIQLVVIALFAMPAAVHTEIADSSVE